MSPSTTDTHNMSNLPTATNRHNLEHYSSGNPYQNSAARPANRLPQPIFELSLMQSLAILFLLVVWCMGVLLLYCFTMWESKPYRGRILNILAENYFLPLIPDWYMWPILVRLAHLCAICLCVLVLLRLKSKKRPIWHPWTSIIIYEMMTALAGSDGVGYLAGRDSMKNLEMLLVFRIAMWPLLVGHYVLTAFPGPSWRGFTEHVMRLHSPSALLRFLPAEITLLSQMSQINKLQ
ncbi:hypothetical protein CPB86DRAFT_788295 [Serendipita vermifera]|nr:hypothetical protein CPB86DRAFT_788295 [Serendipita vermifera]